MKETSRHKLQKKTRFNFWVDVFMFLLMVYVTSSGLLMKYVLLPGSQRQEKYGGNVDLYLLGLDRHEWGSIHFVAGLVLIVLLVVHVVFHWKNIKGIYGRLVHSVYRRRILAWVLGVVCLIILVLPFFLGPTVLEKGTGLGKRHALETPEKKVMGGA